MDMRWHPFLDENPTQHGLRIPQHPRSLETSAFSMVSSKFVFSFTWLNVNFIETRMFRIHSAILCAGRRGDTNAETKKGRQRAESYPQPVPEPYEVREYYHDLWGRPGFGLIARNIPGESPAHGKRLPHARSVKKPRFSKSPAEAEEACRDSPSPYA